MSIDGFDLDVKTVWEAPSPDAPGGPDAVDASRPILPFTSSRYAAKGQGYELSSHGDKRFSAFFSKLRDGRSIEEAYQLDVKGYRAQGHDWRLGKGQPAIDGRGHDALWVDYLALWRQWASENPQLIEDLRAKATGLILTDKFASSPISQARALAQILNETAPQPAKSPRPGRI